MSFDTVYPALGSKIHSDLAASLGAALTDEGCIKVDAHQRTNVPGLYAAGDVVVGLDQISHAMGRLVSPRQRSAMTRLRPSRSCAKRIDRGRASPHGRPACPFSRNKPSYRRPQRLRLHRLRPAQSSAPAASATSPFARYQERFEGAGIAKAEEGSERECIRR